MTQVWIAVIAGIILSLITVVADIFIKQASLQSSFSGWKLLVLGSIIYGLTAFGWFFVIRKIKLSTAAVLYSISIILFLTLTSVFYFKEKINIAEIIGICMALASLILLSRFA